MSEEAISEEFARELLSQREEELWSNHVNGYRGSLKYEDTINAWKQKGYIKQGYKPQNNDKTNKEYFEEKRISLYHNTGGLKNTMYSKIDKDDYIVISDIQGNELNKIDIHLKSREEEIRAALKDKFCIDGSLKGDKFSEGSTCHLSLLYDLIDILDKRLKDAR